LNPSEASGPLSLWLLGPPRIERDGEPVEVDTRKAIALIAYLAVTRQVHSRESLAALLWPEYTQERAFANLRRTLWAFNKAAGATWLDASSDTIGLARAGDLRVDVDAFRDFLAECRAHGHAEAAVCPACLKPLSRAVELYRDDFLAGFTLRDSPAFDEWQFFEAEGLRAELASALERLVRGHTAQGDLELAIEYARRWLALDSLHEPAHRELMKLYAWSGRRSAALRQYQECVRVLDEELGASPEEETALLHDTIQRNELPAAPGTTAPTPEPLVETAPSLRNHLPQQPTPFVGRAHELAEIANLLNDPDCNLLTLVGPGGIGKTRLALEATARAASAFPHGVHFVSLAAVESARFLVPTIAAALEFSFFQREGAEPREQLFDYLREKSMLLLLDNFEHLGDGAELLPDLLGRAQGVKLLVTSRERLHLRGEWVFEVQGMRFPEPGESAPAAVEDYSAVELFLQHAVQARADFVPEARDWPDLIRICRLLEGLPLGLELAAAWVRMLSCHEIADEIEQGLDFLSTSMRDVPERHRSLRAVFDHSWRLLSEAERAALGRLSVFRGGFDRDAAVKVAGADLRLLASLADKSLLRRDRAGRYGMHEAVRQYAAEQLGASPSDEASARDQHCQYYAEFLAKRTDDFHGPRQLESLTEIAREIENVRAAWRWATTHARLRELRQSAIGLATFLQIRSLFQEGEEAFRQAAAVLMAGAEAATEQGAKDEIARALGLILAYQAEFAFSQYRKTEAQHLLQQSLALLDPLGLGQELATANHLAFRLLEDVSDAEQRCWQTLDYYRSAGQIWGIGTTLHLMGLLAWRRDDLPTAQKYLQKTNAILTGVGDRYGAAFVLFDLGAMLQHHTGEPVGAKRYYEESLEIRREIGDRWGMAICLDYIGYLARELGDYDEARRLHEESLAISREIGDPQGIAGSLDNLGLVARDEGAFSEARRYFEEGLTLRRQIGWAWELALSLQHVGDATLGQGDNLGASRWYEESLAAFHTSENRSGMELTLASLAECALVQGDYQASRRRFREALASSIEQSRLSAGLTILTGVARLLARTGRAERAAELLVYAQHHQASTLRTRERAGQLLAELAAHSSPARVEFGSSPFEGDTPAAVIEEILAEI
jgi:predicted ATPase/DNA-binding SARP family transcriptional activator